MPGRPIAPDSTNARTATGRSIQPPPRRGRWWPAARGAVVLLATAGTVTTVGAVRPAAAAVTTATATDTAAAAAAAAVAAAATTATTATAADAANAAKAAAAAPATSRAAIETAATMTPAHAAAAAPARPAPAAASATWPHPARMLADGPGVLAVLGVRDGGDRLLRMRADWPDGPAAGPLGDALAQVPNLGALRIGLFGLAMDAGTDPWTALASALGDRLAIGLFPAPADSGSDEPLAVAIAMATGERAEVLDVVLASVARLVGIERGGRLDPERSLAVGRGRLLRISPELAIGRRGPYLIASPSKSAVRQALEALDDADVPAAIPPRLPESVAERPAGLAPAAGGARHDGAAATGLVPSEAGIWLELSPSVLAMGTAEVPERLDDAAAAIVGGGVTHALAAAERAIAWLSWDADALRLGIEAPSRAAVPPAHRGFAFDRPAGGDLDAAALPGYLGEVRLPRDLAAIVRDREAIMTIGASGQLIEFVTGLSAVMGGFDVLEEVFARLDGPLRLVAVNRPPPAGDGANRDAGDARRPVPELPMLALELPVADPSPDLADRVRSATLTAMGIVNVERGNVDQPGLVIDVDRIGDLRYVSGRFPDPPPGVTPDVIANVAPAVAVLDGRILVTTDPALLEAIVRQLDGSTFAGDDRDDERASARDRAGGSRERDGDPERGGDRIHLDGPAVHSLITRNRETLIAGRMVEEGESRVQAEAFVDRLLAGVDLLRDLELRVQVDDRGLHGRLAVRLRTGATAGEPDERRADGTASRRRAAGSRR